MNPLVKWGIGVVIVVVVFVSLYMLFSSFFGGDTPKVPQTIEDYVKLDNEKLRTELKTTQKDLEDLKLKQASNATAESLKKEVEKMLAEVETLKTNLIQREEALEKREDDLLRKEGKLLDDQEDLAEDKQKLNEKEKEFEQRVKNKIEDLEKINGDTLSGMEEKAKDAVDAIVQESNDSNRPKNQFTAIRRETERKLADLRRRNKEDKRKMEKRFNTEIAWLKALLRA